MIECLFSELVLRAPSKVKSFCARVAADVEANLGQARESDENILKSKI